MLLTTASRVVLCATTVPVLLLAGGCAEGRADPSERLGELITDTVNTTDENVPSLGLTDGLYDPVRHICAPTIDASGDWRTQAPGRLVEEGPVELGVHGAEGIDATELVVTVVAPDGERFTTGDDFVAGEWSRTVYPDDFTDAGLEPGVHSVIWSDGQSRAPLACDGFEVQRQ